MDERPEHVPNAMDAVLEENRQAAYARMELVDREGTHLAWVTKTYAHGDMNPIVEWKGLYFLPVTGLKNIWRETAVSRVTEV